ncbi:hypothetical protein [Microscilla marina]|uniref:Uncharacterized protein n=1 Tax=Microscilla marina ATCC 23134 TaxID=313606 RepID=A1ZQN5_MICM2|nr:hypothetical protein [Microscilla marina]EAY27407.1 hypothetical protein M23134_08359 [Microscilla marina ATCC 23134]
MMPQFTFISSAQAKGTLLSFAELKKGNFVVAQPSEKFSLATTMVTDIPDKLWDFCQSISAQVQRKVIKPNGYTLTTFVFAYQAPEFDIQITRKLKDSFYILWLPNYAESPENYQIEIEVSTESSEIASKIQDFLLKVTQDKNAHIR